MRGNSVRTTYPLSPIQAGMLFHGLQDSQPGVDIEQIVIEMQEPIAAAELRRAWSRVVQRHDILRTSFVWEDVEVPQQVVHDRVEVPFREEDWRGRSADEIERDQATLLEEDRAAGFDFAQAPLMRLTLARLAESGYRLLWTFHHALLDGRSFPIVLQEVFQCYEAGLGGADVDLPLPRPFRAYIEWLQTQDFDRSRDFWRERLKGIATATPFGVDCSAGQRSTRPKGYREQSITLTAGRQPRSRRSRSSTALPPTPLFRPPGPSCSVATVAKRTSSSV